MGDWNTDGLKTPGVVRGNIWYLRNSNSTGFADIVFSYGKASDFRIVGDWDGDGTETPGVVRPVIQCTIDGTTSCMVDGTAWYLRNSNTPGVADIVVIYSEFGVPMSGDWDGDNIDTPGVVNGNEWLLRNSNTDGQPEVSFFYGRHHDVPVVGDWDGDGADSEGVVRGNIWYLRNPLTTGIAESSFAYGRAGDEFLTWEAP